MLEKQVSQYGKIAFEIWLVLFYALWLAFTKLKEYIIKMIKIMVKWLLIELLVQTHNNIIESVFILKKNKQRNYLLSIKAPKKKERN